MVGKHHPSIHAQTRPLLNAQSCALSKRHAPLPCTTAAGWDANNLPVPALSPLLPCDSCMSGYCLNYDSPTRPETNAREPTRVWRLSWDDLDHSVVAAENFVCPFLVRPISPRAEAIILGERILRIARKEAELANLSKLHGHRGWCAESTPITWGAPPMQRESPMLNRIVEATEIEVVVKIEFVRWL